LPPLRTFVVVGISGPDVARAIGHLGGTSHMATLRQFLPALLDHGICELDDGEKILLFGVTPSACADVIRAARPRGILVLVDGSRLEPVIDLVVCLDACRDAPNLPAVSVGVYGDAARFASRRRGLQSALISRLIAGPVLSIDLHKQDDLYLLLDSVLVQAASASDAPRPA